MPGPVGIVFGAASFSRRSLLGAVAAGVAGGGLAAASDEQSAAHRLTRTSFSLNRGERR